MFIYDLCLSVDDTHETCKLPTKSRVSSCGLLIYLFINYLFTNTNERVSIHTHAHLSLTGTFTAIRYGMKSIFALARYHGALQQWSACNLIVLKIDKFERTMFRLVQTRTLYSKVRVLTNNFQCFMFVRTCARTNFRNFQFYWQTLTT